MSRWILLGVAVACGLYAYAQLSGRRLAVSLPRRPPVVLDPPAAASPLSPPAPLALAALLVIALCFALFEVSHAAGYSQSSINNYDEGAYTVSAQLLLAGYHLFAEVFSAQPAWFLGGLALGMRLLGQSSPTGVHLVEMGGGLLGLLGAAWIAWAAYGSLAAIVAAVVLALSPGFLVLAHAGESEMPMLGLALLSLGALAHYARRPRRALLLAAGLLLGAALEMKLLAGVYAVPAALWAGQGAMISGLGPAARRAAVALGLLGLAVLLPVGLTALLLAPAAQIDQVVTMHLAASRAMPLDIAANAAALRAFLGWDPALLAVAVVGTLGGLLARPVTTLAHLVWLGTTVAFLLLYHPQIMHQLVIILPPVAALAGGGVAGLRWGVGGRPMVGWAVAALAVAAYGLQAPALVSRDATLFFPTPPTPRTQLAAFVAAHTAAGELIVTDDLFVAIDAHRLVPPPLADAGSVRITAGYLTAAQAIAATERYHVRLVALWRGVYAGRLPDYVAWLESHGYRPLGGVPPGATVLVRGGPRGPGSVQSGAPFP